MSSRHHWKIMKLVDDQPVDQGEPLRDLGRFFKFEDAMKIVRELRKKNTDPTINYHPGAFQND